MLTSLKQLLASIVDYAGLFPPAQLSLSEAVALYDRAQASSQSWLLNRFAIPAARLQELSKLRFTASESIYSSKPWALSVILSRNWATELEQIDQIRKTGFQYQNQIKICALEVAPLPPAEIQQMGLSLPAGIEVFFEIPLSADLEPYLKVLQQTGTAAKLRTGGTAPDAFPDSTQLSQHILSFANAQIPFKATAGLHHALRGSYRLTDQPGSPSATMQGFLNLALLAVFVYQQHITLAEALEMLEEQSIAPFQFTNTAITWRDRSISVAEIQQSRQHFFRSFGSCSFQEPIDDLHHLRFL
ncbi:hypothetical protein IFO70_28730 [Phormidium tenue FACHB-886]|nr:hypothetical protein [Phormidium tenue FACHB-886]